MSDMLRLAAFDAEASFQEPQANCPPNDSAGTDRGAAEAAAAAEHADGTAQAPALKDAAEIVEQIVQTAHQLRALLNSSLSEFELNDVRYTVLSIVGGRQESGCTQSELADALDQSESSISTLVDRMRTSGLLYRLRSKTDRRKRVLMLTDRGRSLMALADGRHRREVSELLTAFEPEERTALLALLRRLLAEIIERRSRGIGQSGSETRQAAA
ncbi:MAG: MarR family transcriptional regulator [Planctomycetes bacterium]|nr:MarR family transcriptional regulator [Planctomycetota bacterium]